MLIQSFPIFLEPQAAAKDNYFTALINDVKTSIGPGNHRKQSHYKKTKLCHIQFRCKIFYNFIRKFKEYKDWIGHE